MQMPKRFKKRKREVLGIISIVVFMLLTACSPSVEFLPKVEEIKERSSAAAFLASEVEKSRGFISATDPKNRSSDYAYLYDNSLAAVALSCLGAQSHAEKIADAIVFAQAYDRAFHDGRLRNAYSSGNPKSDSGRSITSGKVTVRLPGFWKEGLWQEDYYTVSTSTGNMAWAIFALCTVAEHASGSKKENYLDAAMKAADFVLTLKSDSGGFTAGYEGWDEEQTKATYKSTEHNLSLIPAFSILANSISQQDSIKAEEYREAAVHAKRFVLSMYNKKKHCFYTGTQGDGKTVSKGVIPLDTNSLAVLILKEELTDMYRILEFVEEHMSVGKGFDFSAGDLDGIWNEGTAQMAVCYSGLGGIEKYESVMAYLETQKLKDGSIPATDRDGVSTGFVIVGSDSLWEYNNVQSISATGWLALAQMKVNPFQSVIK